MNPIQSSNPCVDEGKETKGGMKPFQLLEKKTKKNDVTKTSDTD